MLEVHDSLVQIFFFLNCYLQLYLPATQQSTCDVQVKIISTRFFWVPLSPSST